MMKTKTVWLNSDINVWEMLLDVGLLSLKNTKGTSLCKMVADGRKEASEEMQCTKKSQYEKTVDYLKQD